VSAIRVVIAARIALTNRRPDSAGQSAPGRSVGEGGQEREKEAVPVDNCKRYPQV